jgi:hypothetical protein
MTVGLPRPIRCSPVFSVTVNHSKAALKRAHSKRYRPAVRLSRLTARVRVPETVEVRR